LRTAEATAEHAHGVLREIPDSGHNVHQSNPAAVTREIAAFAAEL
jgi:pimeloyl-ACP methyl ester carboxylesterase